MSRVKAIAPGPMSGSRPSMLGVAWWRLCLPFHQPRQSPAKTAERILAIQSFHRAESNICRWDASWPRKPNWVTITPSAAARTSWNQEFPSATIPTHTRQKPTTVTVIRRQYQKWRRSSRPLCLMCAANSV